MDCLYITDDMYWKYFLMDVEGRQFVNPALLYPAAFNYIYNDFVNNGGVIQRIESTSVNMPIRKFLYKINKLFGWHNDYPTSDTWNVSNYLSLLKQTGTMYDLTRLDMVLEEFVELGGNVIIDNQIIHNNLKTRNYKNWKFLLDHIIKH